MNETEFNAGIIFVGLGALLIGWLYGVYVAAKYCRTQALKGMPPVYMRCKDCGLEHAVYLDGKAHALRPEPKIPRRRPGIED